MYRIQEGELESFSPGSSLSETCAERTNGETPAEEGVVLRAAEGTQVGCGLTASITQSPDHSCSVPTEPRPLKVGATLINSGLLPDGAFPSLRLPAECVRARVCACVCASACCEG